LNNDLTDGTRSFLFVLSNPTGGTPLGQWTRAQVVILDNERGFHFGADSWSVAENEGEVTLSIEREGDFTAPATVDFRTFNGTAIAGADYMPVMQTIRFAPGETRQTVTVPVLNDALKEPGEWLTVQLRNPTGGTLGQPAAVRVYIRDNETGVSLGRTEYGAWEGANFVSIDVYRGTDSADTVTVDYLTVSSASPVSATPGADYIDVAGTLTFGPGEQRKWHPADECDRGRAFGPAD
jgi:hypothetical protein